MTKMKIKEYFNERLCVRDLAIFSVFLVAEFEKQEAVEAPVGRTCRRQRPAYSICITVVITAY